MTDDSATHALRSVQQMLKLSRREVEGLVEAGFVAPQVGDKGEWRFTFQDIVLLRTAWGLLRADIPLRRVVASLKRLRASLPESLPLSGLRIAAVGNDVAVIEGGARWAVDTGQSLMAFDVAAPTGADAEVAFIDAAKHAARAGRSAPSAVAPRARSRVAPRSDSGPSAEAWVERGEAHEPRDAGAAEAAYRAALAADPGHVRAALNLGALLCEAGRCAEAIDLYEAAVSRHPDDALLHFNRAIALEDASRNAEALHSYERCIALAPEMADAHFNAARLYELAGDRQKALRHFSSYRRLERR